VGKHHKSIIRQTQERFDGLMALNASRYDAKKRAREEARKAGSGRIRSFSTGKIHSFKTRTAYQKHTMRFVKWARDTEGIKDLEQLDPQADELASRWLQMEVDAHKSLYALQTARASLRMFFSDRVLVSGVQLPKRHDVDITRSHNAAARDLHFQPADWPEFMTFQGAVGLRKGELERIRVGDIRYNAAGRLVAVVRNGKGGKAREAPVLSGCEQAVLDLVTGRKPEEKVLAKVPDADVHGMRRDYAQALYRQYAPGWPALPPKEQRLQPTDYNRDAVKLVSKALGHNRLDVVLNNYLQ